MGKHGKNFTVTTDQADYAPGDDAVFTAKVDKGSTVEFLVAHVNAGDDGIYGTDDDLYTYDLSGTGLTWSVTDGSEDDTDGLLNGVVVTSWHVNLDAAYQAFVVFATDLETGKSSTAFFTDAPPDVGSAAVDLTVSGNSGDVDGVVFQAIPTGAGSGNFPAFVQIEDSPNEEGYNTDARPQQFDEKNSATHNHSVLLSDIPIVIGDGTNGTVAGVAYRVFLFDSNESSGQGNEFLSLDSFQIYQAGAGNLTNLTPGVGFPGSGDSLRYDLDANGDVWIALDSSLSSGGGTSDGVVLVPNNLFLTDSAHQYVYVYSAFGGQGAAWAPQSGFEEWALGEGTTIGSISGTKFQDADGLIGTTNDRTPLAGWTIYIDVDSSNTLNIGDISTTTDANGKYVFETLLAGTYTIREDVPTGWHQLSPLAPDEYTIVLDAGENDTAGNDFINAQDTPVLNIVKNAAVSDGTADETSDVITYSYTLTNTGNVAISGIVLTDDNGTPGNTSDDFSPTFVSGDADSDSQLDLTETWTYTRTKAVTQTMLDSGADIVNIVTADDGAGGASPDTDDATVEIVQSKTLNVEKTASVSDGAADETSDVITYSYTLTNTGNAAISGIVLTDDNGTPGDTSDDFAPTFNPAGDADSDGALDVGETWTYSATRSVTQAMLDEGTDIVNIVTADSPQTPADTDDATVEIVQSKTLNVEKTASVSDGAADETSDVITYSYTLTNTGNAAISGIVLTDDNGTPGDTSDDFAPTFNPAGDADSDGALDVGETWTYSATRSVNQAMLDEGTDIVNIVTADSPETPADTDDATVEIVQSKTLNVEKTASVSDGAADETSDVITYSYTLTNTGNAAISGIVVTDDNGTPGDTSDDFAPTFNPAGDADSDGALDVGETWTYSATRSVTQAMLDAGTDIVNIVTADSPETPADTDDATVEIVQSKTLNVEKTASVGDGTADETSDVITYSYTLTNTGNAAISGIVLTDDNGTPGDTSDDFAPTFNPAGDADSDGALDVGETWTYSATRSVTQAMLDAGTDIVNIVTADSPQTPADTDDATVEIVQSKSLNVEKNAAVGDGTADETSDVITYSYTLTNTGNAAISGIVLTDDNGTPGDTSDDFLPDFVGGDTDGDSALDVGETWTYSRTKAVTQAMLDEGTDIVNIVTADDGPDGAPSDTDDATVDIVQGKSLNVEKNASVSDGAADETSDVITYSYTLTNTGNVAISGIVLTDDNGTPGDTSDDFLPDFVGGDTDGDSALDVGETWTYSRTKAVTQAMLDEGTDIVNIVTADDGPDGAPSDTDDATVDIVQSKTLNVEKNASVGDGTADETSDVITYSYTLTNTGNAAISGIVLADDNGTPGDTSDDFLPDFVGGDTDGDSALDVGETWTYSRTKAVTQAMLDDGTDIVNIVTADDGPDGAPSDTDDATVEIVQSKTLNVEKNASVGDGTADETSDVITYSYTLTNTGNAAISGIVLTDDNGTPGDTSDDFLPDFVGGDTDGDSALDVGETWTYSRTKAVTQAMLDDGSDIVNIVTADSPDTPSDTDDATVEIVQSKSLNVEKNAAVGDGAADETSDVITYSYTLTNTGNAAISGIVLTDDNGTPGDTSDDFLPDFVGGDTDGDSALDVGETWTYSRTKAVTQAMLDEGTDIVNIVTADGPDTPSDTDDATVEIVQSKSLNIEKNAEVTGGTADVITDEITYSYTLTNTGNTAIAGIVLTDDNGTPGETSDDFSPDFVGGDTDGDSELDVGETWTYTRTRAVTQEMINDGNDITNIVTADDGEGGAPADTDDATVDVVKPAGELDITKTVVNIVSKGKHADKVGDVITYRIVVDNTGDTPLTGVVVTDTVEGHAPVVLTNKTGDVNNDGILGINETWTYTFNHTLTANDLFAFGDDNRLDNTVTVVTNQTVPEGATAATDLGTGVKTFGQWSLSSHQKFWDGIANNETPSQTVTDGFPMSDITRPPYANPDTDGGGGDQAGMVLDPVSGTYKLGILIGDWNLNGETDPGEQTLFYTPAEAVAIMTASSSTLNADARYLLARELIASWLNCQAGNPVVDLNEGLTGDALDAQDAINWAIAFLQARTTDEPGSPAGGDGSLATLKILKTSPYWTAGVDGGDAGSNVDGVSPVPFFDDPANDGDIPAGATLTSYLNEYNNEGTILGVHIALE